MGFRKREGRKWSHIGRSIIGSLTEILAKPIREGNMGLEKQYKLLLHIFLI
jgi:hypothetical protein